MPLPTLPAPGVGELMSAAMIFTYWGVALLGALVATGFGFIWYWQTRTHRVELATRTLFAGMICAWSAESVHAFYFGLWWVMGCPTAWIAYWFVIAVKAVLLAGAVCHIASWWLRLYQK